MTTVDEIAVVIQAVVGHLTERLLNEHFLSSLRKVTCTANKITSSLKQKMGYYVRNVSLNEVKINKTTIHSGFQFMFSLGVENSFFNKTLSEFGKYHKTTAVPHQASQTVYILIFSLNICILIIKCH